jgi:hypothetical protein
MPKIFIKLNLRVKILKSSFEFEYLIKWVQIICAMVLMDRGQQYDSSAKRIIELDLQNLNYIKNTQTHIFEFECFQLARMTSFIDPLCSTHF